MKYANGCFITTAEECYKESKKQGYEPGDSSTGTSFESSSYSSKTCYGYKKDTGSKYPGHSFWGLGGSLKDNVKLLDTSEFMSLSKPCLAAGNNKLPLLFQYLITFN